MAKQSHSKTLSPTSEQERTTQTTSRIITVQTTGHISSKRCWYSPTHPYRAGCTAADTCRFKHAVILAAWPIVKQGYIGLAPSLVLDPSCSTTTVSHKLSYISVCDTQQKANYRRHNSTCQLQAYTRKQVKGWTVLLWHSKTSASVDNCQPDASDTCILLHTTHCTCHMLCHCVPKHCTNRSCL